MGSCFSREADPPLQVGKQEVSLNTFQAGLAPIITRTGSAAPGAASASPAAAAGVADAPPVAQADAHAAAAPAAAAVPQQPRAEELGLLAQVNQLMQSLNQVSQTPSLALPEFAAIVAQRLGADLCSIYGIVPDSSKPPAHTTAAAGTTTAAAGTAAAAAAGTAAAAAAGGGGGGAGGEPVAQAAGATAVLLATCGVGTALLLTCPAVRDAAWSPLRLRCPRDVMRVRSAKEEKAAGTLPADWAMLHEKAGLSSFLAVPVSAGGNRVLGTLCISGAAEGAFDGEQWASMLGAAASSLLQHLRSPQLSYLCGLLAALEAAPSPESFVDRLLHGAARCMAISAGARVGARLGLVDAKRKEALLLERGGRQRPGSGAETPWGPPGAYAPPPLGGRVVGTPVTLGNTLLHSAMYVKRPRCIKDCAQYFQSCGSPAADVFTPSSSELVAAVVVAPICHGNAILGGLYLTLDTPGDFSFMQEALTGLVERLSPLVHQRLGSDGAFKELRERTARTASPDLVVPANPGSGSASAGDRQHFTLSGAANKQLCTQAILKAVQQKLITSHAGIAGSGASDGGGDGGGGDGGGASAANSAGASQARGLGLVLESIIGRGGFGVCYKATYKRGPAAVKVMYARKHDKDAMKDAIEMAVLSQTSHPHIVQVYDCLTNVVEEPAPTAPAASAAPSAAGEGPGGGFGGSTVAAGGPTASAAQLLPRYRRLSPQEEARGVAGCSMIVMEYMDCGTLRDAIRRGVFHKRVSQSSMAVDLTACVKVLQEVALAVEHLHSRNLLHCDIKPDNILLRTDATRRLGFVCKLADFGLVKMIRGSKQYVVNRSGTGTITHLPPEALVAGARLTTAVDAYAFGILMYELYAGQRAYAGLRPEEIIDRVMRGGARPTFPPGSPAAYTTLAQRCWSPEAGARPRFRDILPALDLVIADAAAAAAAAAGGAAAGGAEQPEQGQGQGRPVLQVAG